jgi:UDP-glucose 4-epimerase
MKILVTGGAGFIGSSVAVGYDSAGHDVTVVDDLSTGRRANLPARIPLFTIDITDHESLERIFEEVRPDAISHHAAQLDIRRSLREPLIDAKINVIGSLSVLELAVRYKAKKIIFASSGGAIYGEPSSLPAAESTVEMPISHYGVAKLSVERYLRAYHFLHGLKFTILRYANVYGPRQNPYGEAGVVAIFGGQALRNEVSTIFGDGSKTRDYVFIEDVVTANLLALEKGDCGVFNIGRGSQVSDYEIFEAIQRVSGHKNEVRFAPHRAGEVQHIALDSEAAREVLGWTPAVGLEEGLARTIDYIRSGIDPGKPEYNRSIALSAYR